MYQLHIETYMSILQEKDPNLKGAPHREDFSTKEEFCSAYLAYLQTTYNLEAGDPILRIVVASLNNESHWSQGSE